MSAGTEVEEVNIECTEMSELDRSKFMDDLIDGVTKKVSEKISDLTDGVVQIQSILDGHIKVDFNGYIDMVLNKMATKLESSQLDQVELPDHKMSVEKTIFCGLPVPADIDFQKGLITGLSSLCKMDDSALTINAFSDPIISAKAVIGIRSALVKYLAQVTMLCLTEDEAQVTGGLKDVQLSMAMSVSREFAVTLDHFDVKSDGTLALDMGRLGEMDLLSNDENDSALEKQIKTSVKEYLQNTIKKTAGEIIESVPFSL